MSRIKVWVEVQLQPAPMARLRAFADVIESNKPADLAGCDACIITSRPPANGAWMDAAGPSLKIIARHGIGYDNVVEDDATARGILVINTPNAPSESTAEHTVALLLALAKRVVAGDRHVRGEKIPRSALWGSELKDRTIGIIGLGRIGRRVAEMCGLGIRMRVLGFDPWVDRSTLPYVEFVDKLEALLARSDAVSLNMALTPQTRSMFNDKLFAQMKPGSYFINCSRGGAVDEMALYRALKSGHLAGAALDVFEPEPPPLDHPLLSLPNVIATPHTASYTDMGTELMGMGVVYQFEQILRGERPVHLVNSGAWPGRASAFVRA